MVKAVAVEIKRLKKVYRRYCKLQPVVREQVSSVLPYRDVDKWRRCHDELIRAVKGVVDSYGKD